MVQFGLIGRLAHLFKTALIVGPQRYELAIFFIKMSLIQFGFCVRNCSKILKLEYFGPIGRPPKYKNWHFFIKLDPFNLGFVKEIVDKFSNRSFLKPIGRPPNCSIFGQLEQTPYFLKRPEIWASKCRDRLAQMVKRSLRKNLFDTPLWWGPALDSALRVFQMRNFTMYV